MKNELIGRVQVLETRMDFVENTAMTEVKEDLRILKQNQFKMFERFSDADKRFSEVEGKISDFRSHADERISSLQAHTDERISSLQAHTGERISSLQAHTDERISNLQAHMDERFLGVEERISELQAHTDERITGVYQAIASQTRWVFTALVSSITIASIIIPVLIKYL